MTLSDGILLDATDMPAWNEAGTWTVIDNTEVLRACSMPSAESVGAVAMLTRTYENVLSYGEGATPDSTAEPMLGVNQVRARDDSAAAAAAVEACGARRLLGNRGRHLRGRLDVYRRRLRRVVGERRLVRPTGVAARGSTTTLVGMSVYGQDANYGGDPPETSMQASLDRLP